MVKMILLLQKLPVSRIAGTVKKRRTGWGVPVGAGQ
jgi:hypothetical protein